MHLLWCKPINTIEIDFLFYALWLFAELYILDMLVLIRRAIYCLYKLEVCSMHYFQLSECQPFPLPYKEAFIIGDPLFRH